MCRHEHELCQYDLRGLSKYEINQHYFEFIRNATKEEREANGWDCKSTRGLYKCRICGDINFYVKSSFKKHLKVCKNNCNGIRKGGSGNIVIIGLNNIALIYPHLIKYFVYEKDAYEYSCGTHEQIELRCPECGHIKKININNFIRFGFSCDFCSDGISYPEKVVALVLKVLGIDFKKQYKFNNYGEYYYDFYLVDYDIIIEVHGRQHYESGWKSYEEEHENDLIKYDIAVLNSYEFNKNYFIVDARESNIKWLRDSIKQCIFFQQFNLNNINWEEIDIEAQKSYKIKACKYWEEQKEIDKNLTSSQIANGLGISSTTLVSFLKWGNKNGLCTYNAKEEARIANSKKTDNRIDYWNSLGTSVYLINNKKEIIEEAYSIEELSRLTNINARALAYVFKNKQPLKAGNRSTYDKKYKGFYVVLAYDWNNNKNETWLNLNHEEIIHPRSKKANKYYYIIKNDGTKWFNKPLCLSELERYSRISRTTIVRHKESRQPLNNNNGCVKYDSKYIGSYVVEEDKLEEFLLNLNK